MTLRAELVGNVGRGFAEISFYYPQYLDVGQPWLQLSFHGLEVLLHATIS